MAWYHKTAKTRKQAEKAMRETMEPEELPSVYYVLKSAEKTRWVGSDLKAMATPLKDANGSVITTRKSLKAAGYDPAECQYISTIRF